MQPCDLLARTTSSVVTPTIFRGSRPQSKTRRPALCTTGCSGAGPSSCTAQPWLAWTGPRCSHPSGECAVAGVDARWNSRGSRQGPGQHRGLSRGLTMLGTGWASSSIRFVTRIARPRSGKPGSPAKLRASLDNALGNISVYLRRSCHNASLPNRRHAQVQQSFIRHSRSRLEEVITSHARLAGHARRHQDQITTREAPWGLQR